MYKELDTEREQFDKEKKVSLERFRIKEASLESERKSFQEEKMAALNTLKDYQTDYEKLKEQFEKFKESEIKKIDHDKKVLADKCNKFKEIVRKFNKDYYEK